MQSSAVSARPSAAWEGRRPRAARLACRDADAARFPRAGIARRFLVWRFSATSPAGCARLFVTFCRLVLAVYPAFLRRFRPCRAAASACSWSCFCSVRAGLDGGLCPPSWSGLCPACRVSPRRFACLWHASSSHSEAPTGPSVSCPLSP
jgi:hypothetical protein